MSAIHPAGAPALTRGARPLDKPVTPLGLDPRVVDLWRMSAGIAWRAARLWAALAFDDDDLQIEDLDRDYQQLDARLVRHGEILPPWEKYLAGVNRAGLFEFAGRRFLSACHAAAVFAGDVRAVIDARDRDAGGEPRLPWELRDWSPLRACPPADPEPILAGVRREALLFTGAHGPKGVTGRQEPRSAAATALIVRLRGTGADWKAIKKELKSKGLGDMNVAAIQMRHARATRGPTAGL